MLFICDLQFVLQTKFYVLMQFQSVSPVRNLKQTASRLTMLQLRTLACTNTIPSRRP